MSESLKVNIEATNVTGKGWAAAEREAKARAAKIRREVQRGGGLFGDAGASGGGQRGGGFMSQIGHGFRMGHGQGFEGMLPGGGIGKLGGIAVAAAGIGALVAAIGKLAGAANQYSETMTMMSENTGISVESAQNLVYTGKKFDVSAEQIETSLGRIAKAQSEAFTNDALQKNLERLKIGVKEFAEMNPDEAFMRLGKALKETGDRAAVMSIIGRGGLRQMAFLKDIGDGIKDVGLASKENIEAVHGFFNSLAQFGMKLKAGVTNKAGQLLRGDVSGFMGGPEEHTDAAPDIEAMNEETRKRERIKAASKSHEEAKALKAKIEQGKEEADAGQDAIKADQKRVNETEKALNAKKQRGDIERHAMDWAGLPNRTAEDQAASDLKREFDRGYDRQQRRAERDAKRMQHRMDLREKMLASGVLKGPWADRMRKTFSNAHDMAQKRDFVEDYNKKIAEATEKNRDLLDEIAKDTKALKKLDAALTLGGVNGEGEGVE